MAGENENSIGTARAYLDIDTSDWDNAVLRAKNSAAGLGSSAEQAFDQATKAQQRAANQLLLYGRTTDEAAAKQAALNAVAKGAPLEVAQAWAQAVQKQIDATRAATAEQARLNAEIEKQAVIERARAAQTAENSQQWFNQQLGVNTQNNPAARRAEAEAAFMSMSTAGGIGGETEDQATSRIKAMLAASQEAMAAEQGLQSAVQKTQAVNAEAGAAFQAGVARQNAAMTQKTSSVEKDVVATQKQRDEFTKLLGQIDPTIRKMEQLDAMQAKLTDARKKGFVSGDDFKTYSAQIEAMRNPVQEASKAFGALNLNTAQARREYGYLLKDIATGQWGRFTQSAATLANNVGLVGLAMSGTGLAVLGAGAALGAFAVAVYKGYSENEKLRVSLIATGQAAGESSAQLISDSNAIGKITGQWGNAAKAMADLAKAGAEFGGPGIGGLGLTVTEISKVTGESIDKIIKDFQKLETEPAKAVAELNQQYNFLTAAQFAQIQAFEEVGRTRDAARIAEAAYTEAMRERAKEVEDNAGWIIRSAHAVRDGWNEAWAAVKSVGAPSLINEQIAGLEGRIARLSKERFVNNDADIAATTKQIEELRRKQWEEGLKAAEGVDAAMANQQSVKAQAALAKFADPKTKLDEQIAKANENRYRALVGIVDPAIRDKINAEADEQITQATEAYNRKEKRRAGPKGPSTQGAEDQAIKRDMEAQQAAIAAQTQFVQGQYKLREISMEDYYDQLRKLAQQSSDIAINALNKQITVEKAHGNSQDRLAALNSQIVQQQQKNAQAQQKISDMELEAIQKRTNATEAFMEAQNNATVALKRNLDAQVARAGMGTQEYEITQKINEELNKQADALARISKEQAKNPEAADYAKERNVVLAETKTRIDAITGAYKQMNAQQLDITNGMKSAWADFSQQSMNLSDNMKSIWTTGLDAIGEKAALTATGVGTSFEQMAKSIEATAIKALANAAVQKLFSMVMAYFGGSTAGATGAGDALNGGANYTGAGSLSTSWGGMFNAKGGTYTSPDLHAHINTLTNGPTAFRFAKGGAFGVMGEEGTEAIMPLSRDSNGVLGVRTQGGGGYAMAPIVNVNIKGAPNGANVTSKNNDKGGVDIEVLFNQVDQFMASGITTNTSATSAALNARMGK